jgi:RNA polymerase sigma-70 factor (ECF subfamily)
MPGIGLKRSLSVVQQNRILGDILANMRNDPAAPGPQEVTLLLQRAAAGDVSAANDALRTIERELRKIASIHMRRERANHTLQTSAVMNEAVIRLLGSGAKSWNSRQHFLAVASSVMRRLLVDYSRRPRPAMISIDFADAAVAPITAQVLDVHKALTEFESIAPRQARLVELRFFGGLTLEESAEVIGISARLADKDWALARAWLRQRLTTTMES